MTSDMQDTAMEYALRVLENPQLADTETYRQWVCIPENRELMLDLMAAREAVGRGLVRETNQRNRRRRIYRMVAAAAAVVLLLAGGTFFWWNHHAHDDVFFAAADSRQNVLLYVDGKAVALNDGQLSQWTVQAAKENNASTTAVQELRISVPRGKKMTLSLSDGTEVVLNGESELTYPSRFAAAERRVALRGEAFFHVAKDAAHPFVVQTAVVETAVLGTKFNVRAYDDEVLHVSLVEGSVRVANSQTGESRVLTPGQDYAYADGADRLDSHANMDMYTAWTEDLFYFDDATLGEIMRTMGRWYNLNVVFGNPSDQYRRFNFWANRKDGVGEALKLLNDLGKVNAVVDGNTIRIEKRRE